MGKTNFFFLFFFLRRLIVVMYYFKKKQRKRKRDVSRTICAENLYIIVHIVNGRGGCMLHAACC